MSETDIHRLGATALDELKGVVAALDVSGFQDFLDELAGARRIVLHGVGREGLMMRGLAMRLFHLGLDAHVLGNMTVPPAGDGDLLVVSAGPGYLSSVAALADTARKAGARVACVTAQPDGVIPKAANRVLVLPAQTMANDQEGNSSVLPMGSLFEGAQFIVFELIVLVLRDRLGESAETMRARHTNLE
jgi:6-phospho-3-hexuloisomerase